MKTPYDIVQNLYVTEKAKTLESLSSKAKAKKGDVKFSYLKYIFKVHPKANKIEIAQAIEAIYKDENVKVVKVNTLTLKPKPKKMGKGRPGSTKSIKKAIVTLSSSKAIA